MMIEAVPDPFQLKFKVPSYTIALFRAYDTEDEGLLVNITPLGVLKGEAVPPPLVIQFP
jgi:hypothetical protein